MMSTYYEDDLPPGQVYDQFLAHVAARAGAASVSDLLDGVELDWFGPTPVASDAELSLGFAPSYLDDASWQAVHAAAYGGGLPPRRPTVACAAAPGDDPPGDEEEDGVPREGGGEGGPGPRIAPFPPRWWDRLYACAERAGSIAPIVRCLGDGDVQRLAGAAARQTGYRPATYLRLWARSEPSISGTTSGAAWAVRWAQLIADAEAVAQ